VCRGGLTLPIGRARRVVGSRFLVCGRQAVKDAGVAVCGALMGDRVGWKEVERATLKECNARGRRVHRWFGSGGEGIAPVTDHNLGGALVSSPRSE
jgi:hypothetical protein